MRKSCFQFTTVSKGPENALRLRFFLSSLSYFLKLISNSNSACSTSLDLQFSAHFNYRKGSVHFVHNRPPKSARHVVSPPLGVDSPCLERARNKSANATPVQRQAEHRTTASFTNKSTQAYSYRREVLSPREHLYF